MGYVLNILFALGTLAALDLGWASGREVLWAVPLLGLAPYLLGSAARRCYLAGRFRLGGAFERAVAFSPLLLQLAAVSGLGWLSTVQRWSGVRISVDGWPSIWLLAGLGPFFLYQCAAVDARARALALTGDGVRSVRAFQLRLLVSALLPFLFYLGAAGLIARDPTLTVQIQYVSLFNALWGAAMLLVLIWLLPFYLRHAWETAPLEPGVLRSTLEEVARRAGFRCRELLVWRTGNQMANAAIVGFTARTRLVFFSDLLLTQLGPRELAAVFAHEMGHARRAHAAVFAAFTLLFLLASDLVLTWSGVTSTGWQIAVLALVLVLGYLSFGFLSRRFELEADLESLRLLGESGPLVRALELVTGAHAHQRSSWRHFSTKDRVGFLERAEREPLIGVRLRLALTRWRRLGFALFGVALALELVQIARGWDEDWIEADLRLGRYQEAAEHAQGSGVDPRLAELARLAASLSPASHEPAALERRALEALERGELGRARDLAELALLRGSKDLLPVLVCLSAGIDGQEFPEASLAEAPVEWQEALRRRPGS